MIETIGGGEVNIGKNCRIGKHIQVIFSKPGSVTFGDYCVIGDSVKIVVSNGHVLVDDWTSIHDNGLVLCSQGVSIGQHCWFGQNAVIDGTGGITIGNGVRVGMYSQLWSHAAAGEQLEGCTLFAERPVTVGDDVWLVGSCIVASGVTLGNRLVALIGSNITKSFPDHVTIAGVPASERPGLNFYREISLYEKMSLLEVWLGAAAAQMQLNIRHEESGAIVRMSESRSDDVILFVRDRDRALRVKSSEPNATVCCVETKQYTKRLSALEWKLLKHLSGNKARFLRWD